ncbi:hypothetical protein BZG36_03516 [Bifiguratus adelaidae]|uniref:ACB domain-containing protein n=1 Tax=Bifiguratus adelaidae TaxID=1938954 RepID=A0A261XY15_9FUNG|nr:hypothetical protein BZG36_03516 [Bifiguratus adelaidae]
MEQARITERYNRALSIAQRLPPSTSFQPTNEEKLKLYGLYKQASNGDCKTTRPAIWDAVGRAKWDAWNKLRDMSTLEAQEKYVETFIGFLRRFPDVPQAMHIVDQFNDLHKLSEESSDPSDTGSETDSEEEDYLQAIERASHAGSSRSAHSRYRSGTPLIHAGGFGYSAAPSVTSDRSARSRQSLPISAHYTRRISYPQNPSQHSAVSYGQLHRSPPLPEHGFPPVSSANRPPSQSMSPTRASEPLLIHPQPQFRSPQASSAAQPYHLGLAGQQPGAPEAPHDAMSSSSLANSSVQRRLKDSQDPISSTLIPGSEYPSLAPSFLTDSQLEPTDSQVNWLNTSESLPAAESLTMSQQSQLLHARNSSLNTSPTKDLTASVTNPSGHPAMLNSVRNSQQLAEGSASRRVTPQQQSVTRMLRTPAERALESLQTEVAALNERIDLMRKEMSTKRRGSNAEDDRESSPSRRRGAFILLRSIIRSLAGNSVFFLIILYILYRRQSPTALAVIHWAQTRWADLWALWRRTIIAQLMFWRVLV